MRFVFIFILVLGNVFLLEASSPSHERWSIGYEVLDWGSVNEHETIRYHLSSKIGNTDSLYFTLGSSYQWDENPYPYPDNRIVDFSAGLKYVWDISSTTNMWIGGSFHNATAKPTSGTDPPQTLNARSAFIGLGTSLSDRARLFFSAATIEGEGTHADGHNFSYGFKLADGLWLHLDYAEPKSYLVGLSVEK